jgi:hypothetical protein
VVCGEVSDTGWRKLSSLVAPPFAVPMPMSSPAGQVCFACRVLDFVIIPDVICGSIAVCHHRSRPRSRSTVGGEPGCLNGFSCWVSRRMVSEEGQLSTGGMWHRSTIGHEYRMGSRGATPKRSFTCVCAEGGRRFVGCARGAMFWRQLRGGRHEGGSDGTESDGSAHTEWVRGGQLPKARSLVCVPKAADVLSGALEGPCSGGNSGADVTKADRMEPKPMEARTPNGFAGGNSQRLVHPVCAEGGRRFVGCARGAMFWRQLRGGSHEGGSDGSETGGSAYTEWVRGRQLPKARSPRMGSREATPKSLFNPLVFEKRSLTPVCSGSLLGVHEQFGAGNPEELFNDRRFGFGRTEGRPARFGDEARSLPNGFGRRALCDERDEGGRRSRCFEEHRLGLFLRQERVTCPTGLPGKVGNVRWSRPDAT